MAIKFVDAMNMLERHRGDGLMIAAESTVDNSFGLPSVSKHEELDVPMTGGSDRTAPFGGDAMGKASSVGLGLALARPERKVLILDGDGALLMNLGTLATISNKAPENLYHFVFENGKYALTGGQPIPGAGKISFRDMAKDAGYAAAYEFDDAEALASKIDDILGQRGPVLVCLKMVADLVKHQMPSRTFQTAKEDLARVFGL